VLIRFGVQNHRSIGAKQELSLAASSLSDTPTGLINCPAAPGGRLLPMAVVYGANASGKSNLISALRYMIGTIRYSQNRAEPGSRIRRQRFALDPRSANAPSLFDADFVIDSVRYHYGFEASDEAFTSEWLYTFPNDRRQVLFQRDGMSFDFGRGLRGRNKVISDLTRPNSLFLSAAAQNGHEELQKVSNFFANIKVHTEAQSGISVARELPEGDVDNRVIEFLTAISTGVTGYRRRELPKPDEFRDFGMGLKALKEKFLGPESKLELPEDVSIIELAHRDINNDQVYFDFDQESAGTRRLLSLLSDVFRALDDGQVIVVDEFDASLHTQACEALLALFSSPATNRSGAQLIATTHDTNLLRSAALRRDEVWFTEKTHDGATHLYPLTDIRTRKGDNIERGYLQGRFGAIPFSGPLTDLVPVES
jgi:hypothetical protein